MALVVETLLLGSGVMSSVGVSVLTTAVTKTATGVYALLGGIHKSSNNNTIKIRLETLDLETKIKTIDLFLKEIDTEKISNIESLSACLQSLHEIIGKIETELKIISDKIKYNNSLYLSISWRKYTCNSNFPNLERYKKTLDERIDLFFKIMQLVGSVRVHTN